MPTNTNENMNKDFNKRRGFRIKKINRVKPEVSFPD